MVVLMAVLMAVLFHMDLYLVVALTVVLPHMDFHLEVLMEGLMMEGLMMAARSDWEEMDSFRVEVDVLVQKLGLNLGEEEEHPCRQGEEGAFQNSSHYEKEDRHKVDLVGKELMLVLLEEEDLEVGGLKEVLPFAMGLVNMMVQILALEVEDQEVEVHRTMVLYS